MLVCALLINDHLLTRHCNAAKITRLRVKLMLLGEIGIGKGLGILQPLNSELQWAVTRLVHLLFSIWRVARWVLLQVDGDSVSR